MGTPDESDPTVIHVFVAPDDFGAWVVFWGPKWVRKLDPWSYIE